MGKKRMKLRKEEGGKKEREKEENLKEERENTRQTT